MADAGLCLYLIFAITFKGSFAVPIQLIFLAISSLISEYFILTNPEQIQERLLDFIQEPPDEYKESVLGAIRHKTKRQKRVKMLMEIILENAKKLDERRSFSTSLKQKFWREYNHICQICTRKIRQFNDASLDHIEPWAKGGKTEESNAQLAHKRCNQRKRDRTEKYVFIGG